MTKKDKAQTPSRLIEIELDEASIGPNALEAEHERKVAIFDLLEENHFELVSGRPVRTSSASASPNTGSLSR